MQNSRFMVRLPQSLVKQINLRIEAKKEELLKETVKPRISKVSWLATTNGGKELLHKLQTGKLRFANTKELNRHIADEYCRANGVKSGAGRPKTNFLPPDHIIRDEIITELLTLALRG